MAVWFATLAVVGLIHLVHYPRVPVAGSQPKLCAGLCRAIAGAGTTFAVLGSVFLALTGGEALYAEAWVTSAEIRDPLQLVLGVRPARSCSGLPRPRERLCWADPASAGNPFSSCSRTGC